MQITSPRFKSDRNISFTRYPKKCFIQIYGEIRMETGWAQTWPTETKSNNCYQVNLQKREFILRGTHKH